MLHYVDDYGSVDAPPLAASAFDFFVQFNSTLNLRTKPSKAQSLRALVKAALDHVNYSKSIW